MKITEQEQQQRRYRIIHTAFELFCRSGIDGVTISAVARAAHVSETAVYRYFGTKLDLVRHTQEILWKEIVTALISDLRHTPSYENKNGYEQIKMLLLEFRALYRDNSAYILFSYDYKLMLTRCDFQITVTEYGDILRPVHETYLAAIRKGLADGSIHPDFEEEELYFAIWGTMRGYIAKMAIYDRMYAGENPWRDRFDLLCALLLSGMKHGVEAITEENETV